MSSVHRKKVKAPSIRQLLSPVHGWMGLLLGWLLYFMFFMGTLSYFKDEINIITMPHAYQTIGKTTDNDIVQALDYVDTHHSDADRVFIYSGDERNPLRIGVQTSGGRENYKQYVATREGFLQSSGHSLGGEFFYRLHFDLHYIPVIWARYLVGIAGFMMLIAIITGVIIHKKFFKDFFTFRARKGHRSWLDAHNALSVLPLPFHLMIAFTGIITLVNMYLPYSEKIANISPDTHSQYYAFDWWAKKTDEAKPATTPNILPIIHHAKSSWGLHANHDIKIVSINHFNTTSAQISIETRNDKHFSRLSTFNIYDYQGNFIRSNPKYPKGLLAQKAIVGMHQGRVMGMPMRFALFLLGLSGTAMIATGLVMWTVKKKNQLKGKKHLGFYLTNKTNAGVIIGVPLATIIFMWANRLLPNDMINRDKTEILIFFISLATSIIISLFLNAKKSWMILALTTSLLCFAFPVLSIILTNRGIINSIFSNDWVFVFFDLTILLFSIFFYYIYYFVKNNIIKSV